MSSSKARVKLYGAERFVPRVPADAEVLGVIERRMQVGALVKASDGSYWQVNGDVTQRLNRAMVERTLKSARPAAVPRGQAPQHDRAPARPVVTVRRRRTIQLPTQPLAA